MNNILLSNEVVIFLFTQVILFILLIIAFYYSLTIIKKWDYSKTTSVQYKLEKRSYLVILIISFVMIIKIFLMPYFAFAIDKLSNIIPGAMCAAGVISANGYGAVLFVLKLFIVFFIVLWLIINKFDLKSKEYKYTKVKFIFFTFIFFLILIETIIDILYLTNISTKEPVLCCTVIFGTATTSSTIPFNLNITLLLILFYLLYFLLIIANIQKQKFLNFITSILFIYISYFTVTYFFSTYIYELPTHQCPFCILQHEYYYIGYIIWSTLFIGTFFSIATYLLPFVIKEPLDKFYKYSMIFNTIFVFICTFYVLRFYFLNSVFL